MLTARRTALGGDPDDARRRLAGTSLELVRTGRVGNGTASITATTRLGDISIRSR